MVGVLLGTHGLHRVGEIEDTGAGLAALLGALTSGAVLAGEYTPSCHFHMAWLLVKEQRAGQGQARAMTRV